MRLRVGMTVAVVALSLGLGMGRARAGLVTWEFTGEVTDIYDLHGLVDGLVEVGSPFTASMTFDADVPDVNTDNPARGEYRDVIRELSGTVGSIAFAQTGEFGVIFVVDRTGDYDSLVVEIGGGVLATGLDPRTGFFITLGDSTGAVFDDDALPVTPFPFDSGRFGLESGFDEVYVRGDITSVVPEPGALALLLLGLAWIVLKPGRRAGGVLPAAVLALGLTSGLPTAFGQWAGGPVLIGGDATDDANIFDSPARGRIYMREGFDYLGPLVGNGKTLAVCVGCDGGSDADRNFGFALGDSTLPGLGWVGASVSGGADVQAFFDNTGVVKIQDAGIVYFPSDATFVDGGLTPDEIDAINANAGALRDFVKIGGGGLFAHAIRSIPAAAGGDPYLWLATLVPEIAADDVGDGAPLKLTCTAKADVFPGLSQPEIDGIEAAVPWHIRLLPGPGSTFGGLSVLATSAPGGAGDVVVLAGPLPGPDCNTNAVADACEPDANGNGIPDECDIAGGTSCDIDGNGVPDEAAACCGSQGGCTNLMPSLCVGQDGTPYFGATCGECTCGVSGACCLGDECDVLAECECVARGGAEAGAAVGNVGRSKSEDRRSKKTRVGGERVQGLRSSRVQGFRSSRVLEFKRSRVPGAKGSRAGGRCGRVGIVAGCFSHLSVGGRCHGGADDRSTVAISAFTSR